MDEAGLDPHPSSPQQDESELIAALRAGDDAAYLRLVTEQGGRMLAVARRYLKNEEDARDAVQEAFISAFRSIGNFEGDSRISTWLHRITVNCALMKIRSKKRKPEESIDDLLPKYKPDGHQLHPARRWAASADRLLESDQNRALVRECIDRLPETYRNVLLLRDIEELSTEEAAELLGITVTAVKVRLHRARQALRGLLDPRFRGGKR
jgi:RNA polymerase sigma-70 factor (ECF subfamily)